MWMKNYARWALRSRGWKSKNLTELKLKHFSDTDTMVHSKEIVKRVVLKVKRNFE